MREEEDIFVEFLRKKNLRLTPQREKILQVFLKTNQHLTVEELYNLIKKRNSDIGQATVFRTLKLLCAAGIAKEVELGDKKIRFEHKYGHPHHDHLVCIECGRFIEVVDVNIEKLQNALCEKFEFLPKRHKLEIFGVCKKCRAISDREGNVFA